jgi:flagellar M-ring protein FliF
VKAVVSLVSSAVKNLDPSNVTVTDASGHLLSSQGGGSSDQMSQQAQYEDALSAQAQSMLDSVLGGGKSVVRINAALDFSQTTTDRKTVDPTKSAATSTAKSTEVYNGGAANAASGQVSVTNSTTGTTGSTNGNSTYSKTDQTTTQDNSEQVDHVVTPPGAVKRLTVAVAVDAGVKAPPAAQLQSLIGNAVGFDSTRGDSLSVTTTPFNASSANSSGKNAKAGASSAASGTMISTVVAGVMLLVITFLLARSVRRPKVEAVSLPEQYAGALGGGSGRGALSAGGSGSAIPIGSGPRALTSGSSESLIGAVDERSDEVAQLLRGWLADNTSNSGAGAPTGGTR